MMIPSEMPVLPPSRENGHGSYHDSSNNIFQGGQAAADLLRSGLLSQLSNQFGGSQDTQQMQMLASLHQMGQQQKQKEVRTVFSLYPSL